MILALLLLAASLAFGWTAAARVTKKNQLAYALPFSVAAAAWSVFLCSLAIGFNDYSIVSAAALQAIAAYWLYKKSKPSLQHDKQVAALLVFGLLLFTALQYARFHYDDNGNLAGIPIDFGFHYAIITSMANGNFPPQNPFYDGHAFNYYYLTHLYSAALLKGGLLLQVASWIPIVFASAAFLALVYLLCRKLFPDKKHEAVAKLALVLILLNGTLAFVTSQNQLFHNQLRGAGFPFENLLIDFFIINYSAALGLALSAIAILLVLNNEIREGAFVTGLLPLINLPCFIITATALMFKEINKKQIAILVIFSLPQIALLLNRNQNNLTLTTHFGWMASSQDLISIVVFWFNNLGPYLLLSLLALYLLKSKDITRIWLALLPPVILANIFIFTPYAWDNFKFFLLFFIFTAILAAYALVEIWNKSNAGKIVAILLITIMTATGFLSVATLLQHSNGVIYTKADLEACKWIDENTPKDAVFLIDNDKIQSCLFATSGRRVYLGFGEWLTNHGIDYSKQLAENREMLAGNCSLIKEKKIDYAYFTPNVKPSKGLEDQSVEAYARQSQVVLEICKNSLS